LTDFFPATDNEQLLVVHLSASPLMRQCRWISKTMKGLSKAKCAVAEHHWKH